eukprot:1654336-Heterocapsa_arctica.AAC.1
MTSQLKGMRMAEDSSPLARYQALPSGMGLPSRPRVLALSRKQYVGAAIGQKLSGNPAWIIL